MSEDSFYWLYNAPPPPVPPSPPGFDSMEAPLPHDLRMPTVNPVGSLHSTDDAALGYLKQRDAGASLRPPETRYYLPSYWSQCRPVQLLRPVLNKLAGLRFSDLRSTYLCLVWDQVPSVGRRASLPVAGRTLTLSAAFQTRSTMSASAALPSWTGAKKFLTILCAPTYSASFRQRGFPRLALSRCVLTSVPTLLWHSILLYILRIETRSLCGYPIPCGTLSCYWSFNSPLFLCPSMSLGIFGRRLFPSLSPSSITPGLFGYCTARRPSSRRVGSPRCRQSPLFLTLLTALHLFLHVLPGDSWPLAVLL
jgi:hypothetical protein